MRNLYYLLLAGLLGLAMSLYGCPPTGGDDDDDGTPPEDDDDASDDDDDDDDDTGGDLDFNGLSFSASVTVVAPAGDDDDEARDDDDSAMDDDDDDSAMDDDDDDSGEPEEVYSVMIDYAFSYWQDINAGVPLCDQHIQLEGEAIFGYGSVDDGSCNNCTGLIIFDPATAVDVSNPAADPDHCDPAELDAAGANFGMALTTPTPDGYGDFIELGIVDAASVEGLGLTADQDGTLTAAEIQASVADYGLLYTHSGLTNNLAGSLGDSSGLSTVAGDAGGGSTWFFYYYFFRNPETNPHEGTDMVGEYGGQAHWIITFSAE